MNEPLQIDHILPKAKGGEEVGSNLCLAYSACNRFKATQTHGRDPIIKAVMPLFNPNTQNWFEHFRWSDEGTLIIGQTPTGRATVVALSLNNNSACRARALWVAMNWHPPRV